jgi:hypothetical protein
MHKILEYVHFVENAKWFQTITSTGIPEMPPQNENQESGNEEHRAPIDGQCATSECEQNERGKYEISWFIMWLNI